MPSFTGKARRSALHRSSCASLRHASGPLHSGHTRISSSLGSIGAPESLGNPRGKEFFEIGRKDRVDAKKPHPRIGECRAFYGILFSHDDDLRPGDLEVLPLERMVVGKSERLRAHAEAREVVE